MKNFLFLGLAFFAMTSCGDPGDDIDTDNVVDATPLPNNKTTWWKPAAGLSFDWDLDDLKSGDTFDADVVDVDAFTTTAEQVAALHAQGKKVIAYLSVGTFEKGRPDEHLLPSGVVGKIYPEWPDERWLDIRRLDDMQPWLNSRFNMIVQKGFDAIEPDNIDIYTNESGFQISEADAKKYLHLLIKMAHQNGLGIGQKNVPELSQEFAAEFDWVLTEDAFDQGWQEQVKPFIGLNKPVFAVEYTDNMSKNVFETSVCPKARDLGYFAVLKNRDLDKWSQHCK